MKMMLKIGNMKIYGTLYMHAIVYFITPMQILIVFPNIDTKSIKTAPIIRNIHPNAKYHFILVETAESVYPK